MLQFFVDQNQVVKVYFYVFTDGLSRVLWLIIFCEVICTFSEIHFLLLSGNFAWWTLDLFELYFLFTWVTKIMDRLCPEWIV